MNFKVAAAVAALSLATVPAAFADENAGWYVGGGFGQFNAGIDDVDEVDDAIESWDESDNTYKLFAGYRLSKFLSFELDYINLGKPSGAVVPGYNVDSAVDGFAPYVIGTLPLGNTYGISLPDQNCTVRGNVIADSINQAIISESGHNTVIVGNFIGTDESGTAALGNGAPA